MNVAPTNPTIGQVYHDIHQNCVMIFDGSKWIPVSSLPGDYMLFLDDERNSGAAGAEWGGLSLAAIEVARSSTQAKEIVERRGLPSRISFDHDLGGDDTGFKFMWWLIDRHLDETVDLRALMGVQVHSANSVGASKLINLWTNFCDVNDVQVPITRVWPMEEK